ncbi:uncharacterized protein ACJ7VT_000702 [Polymixia lowei]
MEEEITMTEEGQGDAGSSEGESGEDVSNNSHGPTKRGRGRPKGSKKLQVWVTHVNLSELGSNFSNGGPTQPLKSRGGPKGSGKKQTLQQSEQESGQDNVDGFLTPRRGRGRPKGSGSKKQATSEEGSGGDQTPNSLNKKTLNTAVDSQDELGVESVISGEEDDGSSRQPRKRGSPKGSPVKKPQMTEEREVSSEGESGPDLSNGSPTPAKRARGAALTLFQDQTAQREGSSMEEEITMTEEGQGDAGSSEGESGEDVSNNSPGPTKRGRGMSKGSKKLQVWVTHVNLSELGSDFSNGGPTQPLKSRGGPKGSGKKQTLQQSEQESGQDNVDGFQTPQRGRGRPKGSGSKKQTTSEEGSGGDQTPKKRGRPKGSLNKKTLNKAVDSRDELGVESAISGEEDDGSSRQPRKRGSPKGSPIKKPQMTEEREVSSEGESGPDLSNGSPTPAKRARGRPKKNTIEGDVISKEKSVGDASNGSSKTAQRRIGRPRKGERVNQESGSSIEQEQGVTGGSQSPKRARGRPKGSFAKKYPSLKVHGKVGRPRKVVVPSAEVEVVAPTVKGKKRGRPGRPRKYPVPSPEELKKPKVWKPLGRPRKYPRVDPPEGATPTPRRGRGRPRKSESKKGAHLRKSLPLTTPSSHLTPNDGTPRKRGRPPGTVKVKDGSPRKRGRPKGSVKKDETANDMQLEGAVPAKRPRHLKGKKDSSAEQEEYGGGEVEVDMEHDGQTMSYEDAEGTGATVIDQDVGFAPLDESDLLDSSDAAMN